MGSANDADPRLGSPWPTCSFKKVYLTLDFGDGDVFQNQGIAAGVPGDGVPWNAGNASALLRAVARVKAINEDATPRSYGVHTIWTYYCRNIANTNSPSYHSLGGSIDVNPQTNYRGIAGDIPEWFNDCFRAEGFTAGDDWSYSDPMHFENGRYYGAWDGTYPGDEEDDEMSKEYEDAQVNRAIGQANGYGYDKMKANGFKGTALPPGSKALTDNPEKYAGFWYALGKLEVA